MDIEEDIKILEKFKNNEMQRDKLERDSRCGGWKIGDIYKKIELNIAIDHILAEREEDKKRIQELEVLEDDLKDKRIVYADTPEFEEKFIPKQKVKEILIEIQEEYNKLDKEIDKQIKDKNKDYYKCKENIAIMQTLAYCRDKFEGLLKEK